MFCSEEDRDIKTEDWKNTTHLFQKSSPIGICVFGRNTIHYQKTMLSTFHTLLDEMVAKQLTDIHLVPGRPPLFRDPQGMIAQAPTEELVSTEMVMEIRTHIHPNSPLSQEEDASYVYNGNNFRIHFFTDIKGV